MEYDKNRNVSGGAGNPCRVICGITEERRKYLFHRQQFDPATWEKVRRIQELHAPENRER